MNQSNSTGFSLSQLSGQVQNGTPNNNSSFSFGQTPGTGFSFGSTPQPTATATVNPLTPSSGFSFGTATSNGGFGLGQSAPVATSSAGGFSFLQPSSSTAITGSLNFGQSPSAPTNGLSFGQSVPSSSTGLGFGQTAPATSSGFSFGQTNPTTSASSFNGFSVGQVNANPVNPVSSSSLGGFGLGQTNPATSSTGLNFGLNTGNIPSGGLMQPASSGFQFGQPSNAMTSNVSSTSLFGQTSVVNTAASSAGLFGQTATNVNPATTSTNLFGQTSTIPPTSASLFGQSTSATSAGLFGQASNSSTQPTSGLFSQTSSTSTQPTSGLFGQTSSTSTPPTSGLFGQTSSSSAQSTSGFFGQTSSSSTQPTSGLFGQTASSSAQPTSGLNFGVGSTGLGSGGLFGQTSVAPTSSGLNFGTPASSSGFNFSSSSAPSSSGFTFPSSSAGLGGPATSSIFSSAVTSTQSLGLGGSLPTSSAISTSAGLGGFQTSSADSGVGNNLSKGDGKSAKETPLPQDIFATIAVFENYKDTEKKCSEDNIRQTATPFHKLVEDTRKLRQHIVKLSNQNNQLHSSAQKLKSSVIQEAENVEMARRTQDTPLNLQGDNNAPEQFFLRLVRSFEERMTFCRNRLEEVERCARSNGNSSEITSDDMKEVLKKEHEMVKSLAAKIYTLHNQLINYTNQSSNHDTQPEVLFKPPSADHQDSIGFSNKNTTILRPALGEGGSGLLNFQNGQQKAKALSLGAAPPTLPLSQTSINQLGSVAPLGTPLFNFNNTSNNAIGNSYSFNTNKPTFGSPSTTSLFGNQSSANLNQSSSLFGSGNNSSLFGNAKSFKKSHESDDYQRKRRM